mgnify:FL=1
MATVIIYSKDYCPYCVKAKQLFDRLQQPYTEIDLGKNPDLVPEVVQKSGGRKTVPQIFINGQHIGGCDDLYALHAAGGLEILLK